MSSEERPGEGLRPPQGLAGGPGPAPPGVDDGTPKVMAEGEDVRPGDAGEEAAGAAGASERGRRVEGDGEAEPRRAPRGDPEEPDPS